MDYERKTEFLQCIVMGQRGFIDKIKMKKIDRTIIYTVFILPVVLLFSFAIYNAFFGKSTEELIKEDNLSDYFYGRVDTMYFERSNHNIKYAKLSNDYLYAIPRLWERYIGIGDSLSKDSCSFELHIFKVGVDTVILDYRDTYKKK